MLAGTIGVLDAPADDRLQDTTESSRDLPALAVNATQTDLQGGSVAQRCTAASRIEKEREEPLVYDGGITTDRVPHSVEVVSDLVADVTGSGIVLAERVAGSGRYPFPFDLVAAQTSQRITQQHVDVQAFVDQFDEAAISDTWLVGREDADGEGVSMDYNNRAEPEKACEASVGLGFSLSWNGIMASGVLYRSGYLAIYSSWTASNLLEFVDDAILPHAFTPKEEKMGQQATLP